LAIADAEMARALRRVSVERGVDPRQCTLVAFGGGGPLHACALADALAMPRILVPPFAGVLSAVGLAIAPERREVAMSLLAPAASLSREVIAALLAQGDHLLSEMAEHRIRDASRTGAGDATAANVSRRSFARMRFRGQGHELEIPIDPAQHDDGAALAARFSAAHAARYGFTLPADAEIVALRHESGEPPRKVRFARDATSATGAAERISGPSTVALSDATLFVAEGWQATALPIGGWMLERR
ncbi:MAG TPA: hydantoinase/oxoprolinase family protein, partial [Gemmatimonadaceae bacterium]|nr:hydantoinase/oxoprolinase family protein [Gemmatimonadaceae bacterium]